MSIRFVALDDAIVTALRNGAADANGQMPERRRAEESGLPCRYCLQDIAAGEPYLTLAHRPFPALQPYAEVGPVFLHADPCKRGGGDARLPPFLDSAAYIVRGYGANDRIVYGSGEVVPTGDIPARAAALLERDDIVYVHVRSASNNCYHCRIERA